MKDFFQKIIIWFLLIQKRLFKKPSFLIILALVFPVVMGIRFTANQKSGLLAIALAEEKPCATSQNIIQKLQEVHSVYFVSCKTPSEARNLVEEKKVDAAWIFDANIEEIFEKSGRTASIHPVVSIVQGEDTVFLAFVRELLYSKVYPYFSYAAYKYYIKQRMPAASDKEIKNQFQRYYEMPELFTQQTYGSTNAQNSVRSFYLLSPLRGMLALWLFMCAFAATLYFIFDKERNSFVWVNSRDSLGFFLIMTLIPITDCAIILLLALKIGGIFTSLGIELLALILYMICISLFCNLLRLITVNKNIFSAAITILLLTMMVVCPVFLKVNSLQPLQHCFPLFYYLNAVYSWPFMQQFAIYTGILLILNIIAVKITSVCKL